MNASLVSTAGMFIFFVATVPQIRKVVKKRNNLTGYDILGSSLFFIGQSFFAVYFMLVKEYITFLLSIPLSIFWFLALYFTLRGRK